MAVKSSSPFSLTMDVVCQSSERESENGDRTNALRGFQSWDVSMSVLSNLASPLRGLAGQKTTTLARLGWAFFTGTCTSSWSALMLLDSQPKVTWLDAAWCSGQSFWKCSTEPHTRQQPPAAYSPLGLSGQDLDRWPVLLQMKHLAYGYSPRAGSILARQRWISCSVDPQR